MRNPNPLDAVGAGTPLAVGTALDLVVLDCPSFLFVLADDPGIVVVENDEIQCSTHCERSSGTHCVERIVISHSI